MVMERTLRFVPASCFRICVTFLNPSARCAQFTRQFVPAHLFSPDLVLASDGTRMIILGESTTLLVGCHPRGAAGWEPIGPFDSLLLLSAWAPCPAYVLCLSHWPCAHLAGQSPWRW